MGKYEGRRDQIGINAQLLLSNIKVMVVLNAQASLLSAISFNKVQR